MAESQDKNLNPVLFRMCQYLDANRIALTKAERLMNFGNGRLGKMIKNNTTPKGIFIEKFLQTFSNANENWLLKGEGDMLSAKSKMVIEAFPLHLGADPADHDYDGSKFETLPDGTLRMRVPVIPYRAFAAGYYQGYQDPEFYETLDYVSIEVFEKHRGHYLAFEVRGDSMTTLEPAHFRQSIFDGVKVVGRELPRVQWQNKLHLKSWTAWVIVHKDKGILIKNIIAHNVEQGIITIHSLNPDKRLYPDEDLKLDEIEQIFNVVKKIDD